MKIFPKHETLTACLPTKKTVKKRNEKKKATKRENQNRLQYLTDATVFVECKAKIEKSKT